MGDTDEAGIHGRYDDVGEVFGNARPATGFSADLLNLYQLCALNPSSSPGILVPDEDDVDLLAMIQQLREQGERVVVDLSQGKSNAVDQQCDRQLVPSNDAWIVEEV